MHARVHVLGAYKTRGILTLGSAHCSVVAITACVGNRQEVTISTFQVAMQFLFTYQYNIY